MRASRVSFSRGFRSLALSAGCFLASLANASDPTIDTVQFNRDIRPILSDRCFACHGPDKDARKADLRLDRQDSAVGSVIVPGKPRDSELVRRITVADPSEHMPPPDSNRPPLSERQILIIQRWIEQGAPYEPHWSLISPRRPDVPAIESNWPRDPIDAFILARLRRESLHPSPEADPATLIRRLSFDLVGLPPAREDVDAFISLARPDRLERLADQLFASPHFGERFAVYWLDLVRYADTVGYHGDQEHHISPYRDYVIDSFNRNLPFDVFTAEQLAGDLMPNATVDQIIATGYNRVLQTSHEGGVQAKEYLAKYSADRVRNVSEVWLAATMGCAECHDHKFDPYTQRDFYSLAAFFADIKEKGDFKGAGDTNPTKREPEMDVLSKPDRDELDALRAEIAEIESELAESRSGGEGRSTDSSAAGGERNARLASLRQRAKELESRKRRTMVTKAQKPRDIRILHRGDWMDESGQVVPPQVPQVLGMVANSDGRPNRLDLARWLTKPDHPMTSRALVNRLWYLYLGVGISKGLNDLGSQADWPTHPELLDWMAVECVDHAWDVKSAVRAIVTSSTYRQSSVESADLRRRDPENRFFARQSRPRLPAETIRDNALALSGLLVLQVGGPSVKPYQPAGYYSHLNFPKREYEQDHGASLYRRSLYTHWQRQYLHPTLKALDAPSREECTAQRPMSNTPAASLALLNDPQFVEIARVFAERILREGGKNDDARIDWIWREAVSRPITDDDKIVVVKLLSAHREHFALRAEDAKKLVSTGEWPVPPDVAAAELAAWTSVARAVFNLDEMIVRN